MTDRLTRLAELSVHRANVQEGQIVLVAAETGLEEQARATAEAAYKRGAKFVDVAYFDPYVKCARIAHADPDTLGFVPQWCGERVLEHAAQNRVWVSMRSVSAPNLMNGLDESLLGKDRLPSVTTANGVRHLLNLPSEEVFTTPDPRRTNGHVTATKPLVLNDGTIIRGLTVRFEDGVAVEIDGDENAEAIRSRTHGRRGCLPARRARARRRRRTRRPARHGLLHTLLDENASSHVALGNGFTFLIDAEDRERCNVSGQHTDFMIGSPEMEVDGVTVSGEPIPVLRNLSPGRSRGERPRHRGLSSSGGRI